MIDIYLELVTFQNDRMVLNFILSTIDKEVLDLSLDAYYMFQLFYCCVNKPPQNLVG